MTLRTRESMSLCFVITWMLCVAAPASPQVVPAKPVSTPPIDSPIPAPPATNGPLFEAPVAATDANSVHEGRFTWGPDVAAAPTTLRSTWTFMQYPVPGPLLFTAAPSLPAYVDLALTAADGKLGELDAGGVGSLFSAFADLVAAIPDAHAEVTKFPTEPHRPFLGYQPVRARWLRSQWVPIGQFNITPFWPHQKYTYQDYRPFQDIRLRGARLYCAARRAQFIQNGQRLSLGERVGFSVSVLGQQIDFMVIEPTISLNGPEKFFAGNDGAQAFTIPLLLGTAIDPIRGIGLPSLGEARVPAVFVTADTEVRTLAEKRSISIPGEKVRLSPVYTKEYHTVSHSDAMLSAGFYRDKGFGLNTDFLLFTIGALQVRGLLELTYDVGALEAATQEVPDDRVLFGFPPPFPQAARTGRRYVNPLTGTQYHDGSWALAAHRELPYFQWEVQPDGTTNPFWISPIYPFIRPHDIRALTDDDHAMSNATSLGVSLGLRGVLGVDIGGPFKVTVKVTGKFTGNVTQQNLIRDALMAQGPVGHGIMRPMTSLSVRPRQTADVTFDGLEAGLHFFLDLGFFGEIDFEKTFINTPAETIASYDSDTSIVPADEQNILRIAAGASTGKPMTQPNVLSHLPGGVDFPTFLQDVPTCLADPTPPPPPPATCEPAAGSGAPPSVGMCLYGPEHLFQENLIGQTMPAGVCPNIQGWLATLSLSGGQKLCLSKYLGFMCEPVSKEQTLKGFNVVSRIWNLDPQMNDALLGIATECAESFVGTELPPDDPQVIAKVKEAVSGLIGVSACDANATLIPESQIIQTITPTIPPSAMPGQICKQ